MTQLLRPASSSAGGGSRRARRAAPPSMRPSDGAVLEDQLSGGGQRRAARRDGNGRAGRLGRLRSRPIAASTAARTSGRDRCVRIARGVDVATRRASSVSAHGLPIADATRAAGGAGRRPSARRRGRRHPPSCSPCAAVKVGCTVSKTTSQRLAASWLGSVKATGRSSALRMMSSVSSMIRSPRGPRSSIASPANWTPSVLHAGRLPLLVGHLGRRRARTRSGP